jgi:MSHA biogenesis protein MshE
MATVKTDRTKLRLGEVLVQQKLISEDQLQFALGEQKRLGKKLGQILIENSIANEDQIAQALARQLNIPHVNLKVYNLKPNAVRLLPETRARRFRAIVLEDKQSSLLVGMADPTDIFAYDELCKVLKKPIELAVVNESLLLEQISRLYRKTDEITDFARALKAEIGDAAFDFGAAAVAPGIEDAPVVKLLQTVFEDAVQVRASDIHIEPQENSLKIRFRIDGVLHLQAEADSKIAPALALRLKLMADLDISEKRLPQDGRFAMKVKQQKVDVRISCMPTQYGESIVMRLLNQGGGMLKLDSIGMPPDLLARFRAILERPNGLVLVTGPTGSGKTTTLYAALSELNSVDRKLITVEDPIEYRIPGINQTQVNDKIELDFARVLRSALRQDPDIVLVGEMRDSETASIGMRAAMTGHLVFSTLHTNDAVSTPVRLLDMGVPPYMVASSLQCVIAQRLVRTVCEVCKAPYDASPAEREWMKVELGDSVHAVRFTHGRGCSHCNGTGYRGRSAVYEMLEMTIPLAEAANNANPLEFVKKAEAQLGGRTLQRNAVELAVAGRTTIGEAMRVSTQLEE